VEGFDGSVEFLRDCLSGMVEMKLRHFKQPADCKENAQLGTTTPNL
jgi:hypothetical protein